jgi:N12 class adenine-specific DNA methylase
VRLRAVRSKQVKDAGSLNSSAIQATEDAEMRRF